MNQKNRVPVVLNDYAIYLGNSRLIGTGEVTLPALSAITSEVSGAGIGGTVEMPVLGKFESMTVGINFRTVETAAADLMKPIAQDLVIRASQQVYDGVGGSISTEGLVVYCKCINKNHELGSFNPGNPVDGSIEMEVLRIRIVKAGEELVEIDKLNGIYKVRGVDYSAGIRADLGI
ncbi:MAG: phage major tail tube protein [Armatimonadota bacterium]